MELSEEQISFMRRALQLATFGKGSVSPNPLVGCVIVHDHKIIGEGWHECYGSSHAEVNAVNSVKNRELLSDSDVYVTLEPCAHFGKTPPCADLLGSIKPNNVFIASIDPNPLVRGAGIKILKKAGISVFEGVLEQEALKMNARFFTAMVKKRPYVILKYAQTEDGFIARENYDSKWISNAFSRKLVHKWRSEEDAILVGKNTAAHDNPMLTIRDWSGTNPTRILIDHKLALKEKDLHLFDGNVNTICFNTIEDGIQGKLEFVKLEEKTFLTDMLTFLHKRKIQSIIIEGGGKTLQDFIEAGLWDEARVFTSNQTFRKGIKAPVLDSAVYKQSMVSDDVLLTYINNH